MTNPLFFASLSRLTTGFALGGLALALSACGGGGGESSTSYTLGGTVTTLTGDGLILENGTQTLNVAHGAQTFTFPQQFTGSYDVTILSQPTGQTCTVANASGNDNGTAVGNVAVTCRAYALYVADQTSAAIAQYSIGADGTLTAAATPTLNLGGQPDSIVVSPDGVHAWAAYQDSNTIANLLIGSNGALSAQTQVGMPLSAQDTLALSPDGGTLYAAEYGAAKVSRFGVGGTGLTGTNPSASVAADVNPSALVATGDGLHLYVANASPSTISGYGVTAAGTIAPLTNANVSLTAYGSGPRGIAVNPNTNVLYVTLSSSAKVIQLNVDSGTGALTFHASQATGGTPRGITVTPSGAFAYVANYADGTVSQYTLSGGTITPLSTPTVLAGVHPTSISISPDSAHLYVTNSGDNTISQYGIGVSGLLTPLTPATVSSNGLNPVASAVR